MDGLRGIRLDIVASLSKNHFHHGSDDYRFWEGCWLSTTGKMEYPDLKPCSGAKRIDRLDQVGLTLQAAVHVRAWKSPALAPIGA
jgi:hypothetical protein